MIINLKNLDSLLIDRLPYYFFNIVFNIESAVAVHGIFCCAISSAYSKYKIGSLVFTKSITFNLDYEFILVKYVFLRQTFCVVRLSGRVPTGIDGLDPLIKGGFLRGDVILVADGTGSADIRGFGKEGIQTPLNCLKQQRSVK